MRPGLLDVAVMVRGCVSLDAPEPIPARLMVCWPAPTGRLRSVRALRVGGSFTDRTSRLKVLVAEPVPSERMRETVVVPARFVAGVRVKTRVAPEPLKLMLAGGIRFGSA